MRATVGVFARIGFLSFGGPAGQIALMHKMIVEDKKWLSEARFLHALNFCMVLPGPEAQQLATYIGWLRHGIPGALIGGLLFVAPGFCAMAALSAAYAAWGASAWGMALFYGLKASVLALVIQALGRIAARTLRAPWKKVLAGAAFFAMFFCNAPFPLVLVCAASIGFLIGRRETGASTPLQGKAILDKRPVSASSRNAFKAAVFTLAAWLAPTLVLILAAPQSIFAQLAWFFSKASVFSFGGAYAVLAYAAQYAVERNHWLNPAEMMDGLAMAETTPGPLILVLQFIGSLAAYRDPGAMSAPLAGFAGACLAIWTTFAPSFAWVFLGERSLRADP